MAKITISDLTAAFASTTAHNAKYQQIEDEFNNKVLYRDEVGAMAVDLDMGINKIINLGTPSNSLDALRLQDLTDISVAIGSTTALLTSLTDTKTYLDSSNVEGAIEELGEELYKETVADMVLLSIDAGAYISTKGYTTAGDGGAAKYFIKTSAAYGGTPDEIGDHTLANGNIAVLQITNSVNVKWFGATGDGVTDDFASITAAAAALTDGDVLFLPSNNNFLFSSPVYTGAGDLRSVDIVANDITVIGYGAEIWSLNSDDPDVAPASGWYLVELKFSGNTPQMHGLNFRGSVCTINTKTFTAKDGKSYNSHHTGFQINPSVGMDYLYIGEWDFDTCLVTDAGNYSSIQCGASVSDPQNTIAIVENCKFRARAGAVNLHNFEHVYVINQDSRGGLLQFKSDDGCENVHISGVFDGAIVDGTAVNNTYLNTASSYAMFLSSTGTPSLRTVHLDVYLKNFTSFLGIDFVDSTGDYTTTGRIVAENCTVPVFTSISGYAKLDLDLRNCTNNAVVIGDAGSRPINIALTGRLLNSRILVGNASTNARVEKLIDIQVDCDYSGSDGVIEAIDTSPTAGWEISSAKVHNSNIKVGGGTAIIGTDTNFTLDIGRNNQYEGATTNHTGLLDGGYDESFTGGNHSTIRNGYYGFRYVSGASINFGFLDSRSKIGDRLQILNDSVNVISLIGSTLDLDGFTTTNQIQANSSLTIVRVGALTWRTESSYGTITQT